MDPIDTVYRISYAGYMSRRACDSWHWHALMTNITNVSVRLGNFLVRIFRQSSFGHFFKSCRWPDSSLSHFLKS